MSQTNPPAFHATAVKLKRASKLLDDLKALEGEYFATEPIKNKPLPPQEGMLIGFETSFRGPPDEYGAIVGDIVHNLRAALDLLACDLVRANGAEPNNVYFPFASSADTLDEMITRRRFHLAGPDVVSLLKSIKPYRGGDDKLRALHDLDIQDKHRELIPTAMTWVSPVMKIDKVDGRVVSVSLVEDTVNKTEGKLIFPVDSALNGEPVVSTLRDLQTHVEGIVRGFRALFSDGNSNVSTQS